MALGWFFLWPPTGVQAASAFTPVAPVVSEGLIRWWPNPVEAHDEVTGTAGHVQGLVREVDVAAGDARVGSLAGWVVLEPGVTNEVFTLSFWAWPRPEGVLAGTLLFQESPYGSWSLEQAGAASPALKPATDHHDPGQQLPPVALRTNAWNHVVLE